MNTLDRYELFIGGEWVKPESGQYIDIISPSTGEKLGEFAAANDKDVDKAVAAAREAFEGEYGSWSKEQRVQLLLDIAAKIDENTEYLAKLESMDNGKPIRETLNGDIPLVSDHFKYFAAVLRADEDEITKLGGRFVSVRKREPIGVVGQMIPWNFPLLMAA